VDATVIASATHRDEGAAWAGHKRRKAIHGFKAPVAADADTALVEESTVTPGNVNDGRAGGEVLPDDPGDGYADSAYRGPAFASAVQSRRRVPARGPNRRVGPAWGQCLTQASGVEPSWPPCALPDREDLWHLEAQLRTTTHALARTGKGCPAGQINCDGVQPEADGGDPDAGDDLIEGEVRAQTPLRRAPRANAVSLGKRGRGQRSQSIEVAFSPPAHRSH
jgi:hypothetical protein